MPVAYLDVPAGLAADTRRRLVHEVAAALHAAYQIADTRVLLHEYSPQQTSTDGVLAAPLRPICTFVVPPGLPTDAKRKLVGRTSTALAQACRLEREDVPLPDGRVVATQWVLSFFREHPLEQAALDELMAFENPMVLSGMEAAMQRAGASR